MKHFSSIAIFILVFSEISHGNVLDQPPKGASSVTLQTLPYGWNSQTQLLMIGVSEDINSWAAKVLYKDKDDASNTKRSDDKKEGETLSDEVNHLSHNLRNKVTDIIRKMGNEIDWLFRSSDLKSGTG